MKTNHKFWPNWEALTEAAVWTFADWREGAVGVSLDVSRESIAAQRATNLLKYLSIRPSIQCFV